MATHDVDEAARTRPLWGMRESIVTTSRERAAAPGDANDLWRAPVILEGGAVGWGPAALVVAPGRPDDPSWLTDPFQFRVAQRRF